MKRNLFALLFVFVCPLSAFALTGSVKDIRVEYNVVLNNQKSIKVHIDYDLKGTAGEKYYITLWFKDSNGNFKYISGDAKSSDKGIGYYVGRYSYSSPGTYSIWFAPALHRLSLKPGERKFEAMAVVHDANMNPLGSKTITVNLPESPNYPQTAPVINTPADKAAYKIALTPVGRAGDVTRSDNRRVDQKNNSSGSAIFAPVAACFLDKVVTLMSERTKRPVVAGISGMVFTCSPDNSSYFAQFRIVFPITFSRSDYSEALKNYYKVVDLQNILSIAYYQGSCCRKVRRLENGCASELYFLSEEQGEKSGWLLEFNTTDKTVFLSQWVLTDDGKHYKGRDNTYYNLKDYSSVYRVFKKALECGIFEII